MATLALRFRALALTIGMPMDRQIAPFHSQERIDEFLRFIGPSRFSGVVFEPFGGRDDHSCVTVSLQPSFYSAPSAFVTAKMKGELRPPQQMISENGDPDMCTTS